MSNPSHTQDLATLATTLAARGLLDLAAQALGIALNVRRLERTLDEIVRDSAEDEAILAALAREIDRIPRAKRRHWHIIQGGAA